MTMLTVPADSFITSFSMEHPPVAEVELSETFLCQTQDCYAGQISSESVLRPDIDMAHFNRATGPVRITGVKAGDAVRVEVESIDIGSTGIMALSPGLGVLGDRVSASNTRRVPIAEGHAWVTPEIAVPIAPMIGVLGLAPSGPAVPSSWPGDHGGNLDTTLLCTGSALVLRAAYDGGLLAVGDAHAVQGDGELGGTGIEISAKVRLRVEKVSHSGDLPIVCHGSGLAILSSSADLETAIYRGFAEAVELMGQWHGLAWNDAYRLTSLVGRAEVSQVVNPLVTARISIPRRWCPVLWSHRPKAKDTDD